MTTSAAVDPAIASAIGERLGAVRARIAAAASRVGRDPASISLLGASKYQPAGHVVAALEAGLRCLGENYVQEAREKQPIVLDALDARTTRPPRWHMIGALQRNKARDAVRLFDVIETVDRLSLAQELDRRAGSHERTLDVFLQVNLSGEPQKAGLAEDAVPALLAACADLENLTVTGLMTIPAPHAEPDGNRDAFARLRRLRDELRSTTGGGSLEELSMGMSQDFETAIEEGATLVRVGQDIFGPRPARD